MKVIGMVGGMSWECSAEYYRLVNELVRERLGGLHSAQCVLSSVDFAEIERLQVEGRWDEAGVVLAEAARAVEAAGADLLVLCTNTMHKVADQVAGRGGHPVAAPGGHDRGGGAAAPGLDRVGLLGTAFTMEQPFYRDRLAGHGVRVLVPDEDDRALVHRVIYDELCVGIVLEESRRATARSSSGWSPRARRGSCWAAPRSSCSSRRGTAPSRCSPRPACTSRRPWNARFVPCQVRAASALIGHHA